MIESGQQSRALVKAIPVDFARNVKARRKALRIAQDHVVVELALLYGIKWHQTTLAKVESGERAVKLDEAYALAAIYVISVEGLIRGEGIDDIVTYDIGRTAEGEIVAREKRRKLSSDA